MPAASRLKYWFWAYLSRPRAHRPLYRAILRRQMRKIVEIGIGDGARAQRMLAIAARACDPRDLAYTAVDLFEMRPRETRGLTLKEAHRQFKATGARVRLLPGDPYAALSRAANDIGAVDLVLISAGQDPESLAQAWFYVPRLLHPQSWVVVEERTTAEGPTTLRRISRVEVERLAGGGTRRQAA